MRSSASTFKRFMNLTCLGLTAIFICALTFDARSAPVSNTPLIADAQQGCKVTYEKIEKQLSSASKPEECQTAFDLYKDSLNKCHGVEIEGIGIFPMVSFAISDCFARHNKIELAKEVFNFSLKHPNWDAPGEAKCDGHEMWKEGLESLELFEKNPPRCVSEQELNDILEKFKKTQDYGLLKSIRGLHFGMLSDLDECLIRFSEFEKEAKENFKDAELIINHVNSKESDEDNGLYYVALRGSKAKPELLLLLVFSSFQEENPDKKTDVKPCYYLTDYIYYENKQNLLEDGYELEEKDKQSS